MASRIMTKVDRVSKTGLEENRNGRSFASEDHFATFEGVIVRPIEAFFDERGTLMEIFRHDELPEHLHPTMAYASMSHPGVVRGPHEHVHQTDLFAFVGPGDFTVTLWDGRPDSETYGLKKTYQCGASRPCCVVIPPGVVHAYKNDSDVPGMVFNAPNRLYAGEGKSQPVDEIRHENNADSPYFVD